MKSNRQYRDSENFVKKFELRTVRSTKKKPTQLSGFLFIQ